jgi:hypothetical protein
LGGGYHRRIGRARFAAFGVAVCGKECGLKLHELAAAVGVKEYATVAMAVKRLETRMQKQRSL